jgi:hypothetical protein
VIGVLSRRSRFRASSLGLIGLAAMAAAGLGSLAVTWWSSPIDKAAFSRSPRLSLTALTPCMTKPRRTAPGVAFVMHRQATAHQSIKSPRPARRTRKTTTQHTKTDTRPTPRPPNALAQ